MRNKQLYLILYNIRQMQYMCKGHPWVSIGRYFALAFPLQKYIFIVCILC